MSVAIGVVAHQNRLLQAWELAQRVRADRLNVDKGDWGSAYNHYQTWQQLAWSGAEYSVVMEDDAVPVDNFLQQLDGVLSACQEDVVGLYLGTGYPPAWQGFIAHVMNDSAHFIQSSHLLHGVATAIKTALIPEMLSYISQFDNDYPIDAAITEWARSRARPVVYCHPSIVDHADGPSLIAHPDGAKRELPRRAWQFGSKSEWRNTRVMMP